MGNVCSCLSDVDADTLGYSTKEVSKYSGAEQSVYRPQVVVSDAQRSSHSSSPERRRAGRDAPGGAAEQQDAQLQQTDAEQAWRSPGSAAEQAEQEAAPEQPEPPSGVPFSWTKGELIGIGAFGRVFSALNNNTGELVAVKQVSFAKDEALQGRVAEHIRALEAEVQVLQTLQHENIVRYLGTQITDDSLHIFLEYVPGGSIASLLAKFGPFPESVIRLYTAQLLRGLEYLHQKGIMHRDIKGANILIDPYGTVKLADFGASKVIEDLATVGSGSKSIRGTPYWMAPEVIKQTGHGRPADIWSLGCTVIEMALGKPPWSEYSTPVAAMFQIASSRDPPKLPEHLSPEAQDFLKICFNRVARDRANATRLLKHPFVANVQLQQPLPFPGHSPASSSQQAGGSSSSSRHQGPVRSGSASAQQQQQYASRQAGGPGGSRSSSSLRPLNTAGGQPVHGAAAKAGEQARHSPGQARNSPRRQAVEGAGSPAAAAGAASHLAQRGDDPARSPIQQQQQHSQQQQQQHKQQQEQLQSKQQQQQQHASPRPHQQQAQPHGQAGSVCSSQEEPGLGLQQAADGCMTLVEWNPMQEPSWAPPYQPAPAPASSSSNRRQPAGDGSPPDKQQQQQQSSQQVMAPVEQQEVADAPRPPASASRAAGIMAAGAAHVTGSASSTTSSSSGSSSSPAAPGQLRHGSLPGPIGSSNLGGKRQGIGSCSVAGPLSKGPAARASSAFGLAAAAAAASGTSPASGSAAAAAGGGLLGSLAAKSGKQLQQPASNLLASVCSPPAAPPPLATSASAAAAARPAAAADGSQQAGGSAQDQWGGGPGSGLRLADVDVAKSTKLAQWENELYEELERHRKEQRASRAAGRSLTAAMAAAPQRQ